MAAINKTTVVAIVAWSMLFVILFFIDPTGVPVAVLPLPFGVLFVAVSVTSTVLLRHRINTPTRIRRISIFSACVAVIVLALTSLGQLTLRDVIVATFLIALSFFYIHRTIPEKK